MAAILMLTPQAPYPPQQGTALRNWGLLRGLSEHHTVSLLTFTSADQTDAPDPVLVSRTARVEMVPQPTRSTKDRLRDLFVTGKPDLTQRLASAQFAKTLEKMLRDHSFDWILIEGLEMAPYLDVVPAEAALRVIFDAHNCEYLLQRRAARSDWTRPRRWVGAAYSSIQWRRLRQYEAAVCGRADIVIAVSDADAAALRIIQPDITSPGHPQRNPHRRLR